MFDRYEIDWQAVSAIATFLAVIVALVPTFSEYFRRKALARNVRARLLAYLIILREVAQRFQEKSSVVLSDSEMKAIHSLTAIMAELSVLEQDEHDRLWQLMADLKFLEAYPSTINKINKDSLDAIDQTIADMSRRLKKQR
jgi:hypothetical protein